jgi:hypothetical protein
MDHVNPRSCRLIGLWRNHLATGLYDLVISYIHPQSIIQHQDDKENQPTHQKNLINHSKRHTLLEPSLTIRRPSESISFQQQVLVVCGTNKRRISQQRIVPNERRNFPVGAFDGDTSVVMACKVGDTVLKATAGDCKGWKWSIHRDGGRGLIDRT